MKSLHVFLSRGQIILLRIRISIWYIVMQFLKHLHKCLTCRRLKRKRIAFLFLCTFEPKIRGLRWFLWSEAHRLVVARELVIFVGSGLFSNPDLSEALFIMVFRSTNVEYNPLMGGIINELNYWSLFFSQSWYDSLSSECILLKCISVPIIASVIFSSLFFLFDQIVLPFVWNGFQLNLLAAGY